MNRLGRAYRVIVYGCAVLGVSALAACSGQAFSVGSNVAATTEAIASSAAGTPGPSCDTGWGHPSVCCDDTGTSCVVYKTPSLLACPGDHPVSRPDGRYCCPLDASGACIATSGSAAASGAGPSCTYACLPGYTLSQTLSDPSTNQCCNAGGTCYAVANPDCSQPVCNCPATTSNTGPSNCTCSAAPACPLPSPPSCNACPSGWQVPNGDPALCCRTDPSMPSVIDCFSQAIPLPPPAPVGDAGTGPAPCIDNGVSHADSTTWKCSDGCNTCNCRNGQVLSTTIACLVDAGASPPANDAAAECALATDCKGALPALCQVCSNGSSGCAHFTCNAGVCAIAYCQ